MKFIYFLLLFFVLTQSSMASTESQKLHAVLGVITSFVLTDKSTVVAPTFINDSNVSVAENNISALTVELNTTESVTYAISDGNSSLFDINSTTGVITFVDAPDYESGFILYTFTVTATDSKGNAFTQEVTIHITNTSPSLIITDDTEDFVDASLVDKEWVADSVTFTFTFSEPVIGFTIDDIIVTGGVIGALNGSADSYTLTVIPPINTSTPITIDIPIDSVEDASGLSNTVLTQYTQEVNTVKAFITTWDTIKDGETSSNQIKIGTNSDYIYNYTIDWGDGEINSSITGNIVHTYANEGKYTIAIKNQFPAIYSHEYDSKKILTIEQWGTQEWKSMLSSFGGTENLTGNSIDNPNLANLTIMAYMFSSSRSFNQDIGDWNVSNVTNMNGMFDGAISFNQNIGSWDVSNVTTMNTMFYNAGVFNQDIGDWNVSSVETMQLMFQRATYFNQDISSWDVSNVKRMDLMFCSTHLFNQDISNWDVSNVTSMSGMFYAANSFNSDIISWNVSNVTDMWYMFNYANSFNKDISSWNVSRVTTMGYMFENSVFNQDISKWDISNVNDMSNIFTNSNLSTQNYDALLDSWSQLDLEENVTLGASNIHFSSDANASRQSIIDNFGWMINDAGVE